MKSKKKEVYTVEVCYPSEFYPDMDDKLDSIAKMASGGSGMGLGYRDNTYYFKSKNKALEVYSKMKKIKVLKYVDMIIRYS